MARLRPTLVKQRYACAGSDLLLTGPMLGYISALKTSLAIRKTETALSYVFPPLYSGPLLCTTVGHCFCTCAALQVAAIQCGWLLSTGRLSEGLKPALAVCSCGSRAWRPQQTIRS